MLAKNILCLDFDGVIVDSVKECLLTAYNSYWLSLNLNEKVVQNVESIDVVLVNGFYKNRFFVRPAKDYWALINLLVRGVEDIDDRIFEDEVENNFELINHFKSIFFSTRSDIMKNHENYWLSLHRLYREFLEAWNYLVTNFDIYIVTNKNKESVAALLKHFNISTAFEYIFTMEMFNSKNDCLISISNQLKIPLGQIVFVDDSPRTVHELSNMGVNAYLAEWGYYPGPYNSIKTLKHLKDL
jgi:FMN phosphatase YigB (HAD superfamily)